MIKRLLIGAALLVTIVAGGYYFLAPQEISVGTELPDAPALFETSLAAPITATADSFSITSNSVRGGGSLSGYQCFTIDEGSAQAEFVCGTASGTAVTNVTRGISPSDGTSEVTALKFAHRRGASVKITDFPVIQIIRNQNNGEATFENALRYAGSVVPSSADDLADVGYVLSVVNGGTVDFDALVVAGTAGETLATSTLVYFKSSDQRWWKVDTDDTATFTGVALGLTRGGGTAGVSITNGGVLLKGLQTGLSGLTTGATYHASSSVGDFNTATSVLPIGVAKSATELYFDPVMIGVPRLAMNNTFTGTNTFNGVTQFNSLITGHASTTLRVYTSTSTWSKPTGLEYITVWVCGGGGAGAGDNGSSDTNSGSGGGGGGGCAFEMLDSTELSSTSSVAIIVGAGGSGGTGAGASGGTSSFGNFLSATGGAGGVEGGAGGAGGVGSNGDINITGTGGVTFQYGTRGGTGGGSYFGGGGIGNGAANGSDGGAYGGGGGGAGDPTGGGSNYSGGSGGTGVVIITEYF